VGTFIVSLIVNDGLLESDPANVTIESISCVDAAVATLLETVEIINDLSTESLKNRNMNKTLVNKINATLNKIENGFCGEAENKLANDLLQKTDGCAEVGAVDKNDWLIDCTAQAQLYPLLFDALVLLQNPACPCFQ
jgi:hypothetical protein